MAGRTWHPLSHRVRAAKEHRLPRIHAACLQPRRRHESRLDQLVAHLKAHSNLTIVDLREAHLDEKSRHQVFYRTDTHWNNRGAYVGYTQIMKCSLAGFRSSSPFRSRIRGVTILRARAGPCVTSGNAALSSGTVTST